MLTLFVRVTSMYAGEGMDNHHFTEVHDIYVKDLKCKKVNVAALVLQGTEEKPIYNVTFDNPRISSGFKTCSAVPGFRSVK